MWDEERATLENLQYKVEDINRFFCNHCVRKTIIELVPVEDVVVEDKIYDYNSHRTLEVVSIEKTTNLYFIHFEKQYLIFDKENLIPCVRTVYVLDQAAYF